MIDPGSAGDWLQATLLATALGALAITGRRALHKEETDQATAQVVPRRTPTGTPPPDPAERSRAEAGP